MTAAQRPARAPGAPDAQGQPSSFRRSLWLGMFLGWQDVRLMYRRSVLGQFWITLSMAITFGAIGSIFGLIFGTPLAEYLPFLGCGLVFFAFYSSLLNDGTISFIAAESFIRQLPLAPITYFLRSAWKTFFVLLHNGVALAVLLLVFPQGFSPAVLLVVPGVIITGAGMAGLGLALAMLATRYRDVPQIVSAVVQICFYLTPIVWQPSGLPPAARDLVLRWNPFSHMLQVVRQPLLNVYPTWGDWATAIVLSAILVVVGAAAYRWKRRQLAFWV
jgi:lipopolysaccharide transport system permease protein